MRSTSAARPESRSSRHPVEGVEGDVQLPEAGLPERHGQVLEPVAVGGQRDLLDPRGGVEVGDDLHDVPAQRGLPPGEPDAPDARLGEAATSRRMSGRSSASPWAVSSPGLQ